MCMCFILSLIAKIYTAVIPMETGLEQVDNPAGPIEHAKPLRGHPRGAGMIRAISH